MQRFSLIVTALVFSCVGLFAGEDTKGNLWSIKYDDDVQMPKLSKDGKYLLAYHGDTLVCHDAATGARKWTRGYESLSNTQYYVMQFPKSGEAIIPGVNELIWVDLETGKELARIQSIGDMSDIEFSPPPPYTPYDTLQPIVYGDLMTVFYDDGMQVIDMIDRKVVHQQEESTSKLKIERWFTTMLLDTETDTVLFVDGKSRSVVYIHDNSIQPLSSEVYQRFFEYEDLLVVLTETSMIVVDKPTAKKIGTILVPVEETRNYVPVLVNQKLFILTSGEDQHEYFDVKTQKRLWAIPAKDMDGIVDQVTVLPNDEFLIHWYNDDDHLVLSKVSQRSGSILWTRKLVTQDGGYESGHIKPDNTLATIASYAAATVLNSTSRNSFGYRNAPYAVGPGGILMANGVALANQKNDLNLGNETMTGLTHQKINQKRTSSALAKVVGIDADKVHMVIMGEAHKAWDGKESSQLDGEGLLTINLSSGTVVGFKPQRLFADQEKEKFNIFQHGETLETNIGSLVIGSRRISLFTKTGNVNTIEYQTEDIKLLGSDSRGCIVYFEDSKGYHQQWYVDHSESKLKHSVMIYSDDLCQGVTKDTAAFERSVTYLNGELKVYSRMEGLPVSTTKPVWTLSEADIDGLKVGSVEADSVVGARQGIRLAGKHIFLIGDDGFAVVDAETGSCKKSREWDAEFKFKRDGVQRLGTNIVYQFDAEIGLIGVGNGCDVKQVAQEKVAHDKAHLLLDQESFRAYIINMDEGTINAYHPN